LIGALVIVPSVALARSHVRAQLEAASQLPPLPAPSIDVADPWVDARTEATPRLDTVGPCLGIGGIDRLDPWAVERRGAEQVPRFLVRPIDATDPWAGQSIARLQPRAIDVADPWAGLSVEPKTNPPPTPRAARLAADDALRAAIKAAIDAGELDRASDLLRILRQK
jgi:hypothetical protein